jgi:hypothetical protein
LFYSSTEIGQSSYCDLIGTVNSLLYSTNYSSTDYWVGIYPLIDLVAQYVDANNGSLAAGYRQLNAAAYEDSFLTIFGGAEPTYDFCPFDTCAMITIASFDDFSAGVSPYNFELTDGGCSNAVIIDTNWYVISDVLVKS